MPTRSQRAVLQCGEKVLTLKIGVVRENFVNHHARGEKFEQRLDRVAHTTHHWLTVAYRRVDSDPL
jgi:hypothetical protein